MQERLFLDVHKADPNWFKPETTKTSNKKTSKPRQNISPAYEPPHFEWLQKEQEKGALQRVNEKIAAEVTCSDNSQAQEGDEAGCKKQDE